jgi:6-methylsalicylate decarboxylase
LRFYYDTANAMTIHPLVSLTKLVAPTQILFGTDFPFLTASATAAGLREVGLFSVASCKTSSEKMQPKEEFISR